MTTRIILLINLILGLLLAGWLPVLNADIEATGRHEAENPTVTTFGASTTEKNPIRALAVRRVDGHWEAELELLRAVDGFQVTLNGKPIEDLFTPETIGTQVVALAPDDGIRVGRNRLKVRAVSQRRRYPAKAKGFRVSRRSLLASAGRDFEVRVHGPARLDGSQTLHRQQLLKTEWRIVKAPAGSLISLSEPNTLAPSFTPDVNGTYQFELRVEDSQGTVSTDTATVSAYPNFPPIGVGIETIAAQPDGGHAIVIGTNCSSQILDCPSQHLPGFDGQRQVFPYSGDKVQLIVLNRTNLEILARKTFQGNSPADAKEALDLVNQHRNRNPRPLVVLSALYTPGSPGIGNYDLDPGFYEIIKMLVSDSEAGLEANRLISAGRLRGGWSAVGVPLDAEAPGPAGQLIPGANFLYKFYSGQGPAGNLKGYLQKTTIREDQNVSFRGYNFVTGDYAAFTTKLDPSAKDANTMRINGVDYASKPLGGCEGGFHLVVSEASDLRVHISNRTYLTNCRSDNDLNQIKALANDLNYAIDILGRSYDGVLVFLQSIGTPITTTQGWTEQGYQASAALSAPIERLGGTAQAFNNAMLPWTTVGYALAGSTALLGDAPKGRKIGVYAPEASGAAPGITDNKQVFVDGMLQRNYLGRWTPVEGSGIANLPATIYQPAVDWPYGDSVAGRAALDCISHHLGMEYSPDAVCYIPSFANVRAEYCNTKASNGVWLNTLSNLNYSSLDANNKNSACYGVGEIDFNAVKTTVIEELRLLTDLHTATEDYKGYYLNGKDEANNALKAWTDNAVNEIKKSDAEYVNLKVAGSWVSLFSNALKVVTIFPSPVKDIVGTVASIGSLAASVMSMSKGPSGFGEILDTTGKQLPVEIYRKYKASSEQLDKFYDILVSDAGKLNAKALKTVSRETKEAYMVNLENSAKAFAYGRLLGAVYTSYGLLPGNKPYNSGYPGVPYDYKCPNSYNATYPPFYIRNPDTVNKTWIGLNYPNIKDPLPVYGGNPNILVLGRKGTPQQGGSILYSIPDVSIMETVLKYDIWPIWFFRHNFKQEGFSCN